uniref:Monocarboxylate transporter 2 n=1 Tax=Aceria tosichella TaxID=561515 RepID=A0A6G1SMU9_9ACAR
MQQISKHQYGTSITAKPSQANQKLDAKTGLDGEAGEGGDEDDEREDRTNLDSGYAWVILVVMFLLQSSIGGAARLYGLVYAKEVAVGYYDREQASWPIATASAVENLAGILSPALVQWLSWRQIELVSSALFVLANIVAYVSDSLALDIIALGLIQGLALSTCTVLSLLINNDYFEHYRTTAYGVSMCGSTFGLLYLGPLANWILDTYDEFRLVYLALAFVFTGNLVLVLFIRPRAQAPKLGACRRRRGGGAGSRGRQHLAHDSSLTGKAAAAAAAANGSSAQLDTNTDHKGPTELGAGAGQPSTPAARKRSRFETHFLDRRDSIASISYMVRSRRNSVLSRVLPTAGTSSSSNHHNHQQQQNGCCPQLHTALVKSKSGVELAGKLAAGSTQKLNHEALIKKVSLCSMRGGAPPITPAPVDDANCLDRPPDIMAAAPLSVRSSQSSLMAPISRQISMTGTCPCPGSPGDGGGRTADSNKVTAGDLETTGDSGRVTELDVVSLYRRLALEYEVQVCSSDTIKKMDQGQEVYHQEKRQQQQQQQQQQQSFSLANLLKLLRLPYLHCVWIMLALYYLVARIFVIILVDFAHDHGLDENQAIGLLNYWSFGELLGRLLLGSLIDLRFLSCRACIALTCSLLALLMTCMVLIESYLVYAICSLLVAALISLEYMLINVMMVEYVGKQMVTNCYSLAACISSLVLFGRPSMIGFFRDRLGSYDGLLLMLATLSGSFGVLFCLLEPLLVRLWPKNTSNH